jgi:hypothetical protein
MSLRINSRTDQIILASADNGIRFAISMLGTPDRSFPGTDEVPNFVYQCNVTVEGEFSRSREGSLTDLLRRAEKLVALLTLECSVRRVRALDIPEPK